MCRPPLTALLSAAAALLCCGRAPTEYPAGPLARPILGLDLAAAAAANAAVLPAGFTVPQETSCGPDVTRGFLAELADHSPEDAKVPLHWAPVVFGPVAGKPTVAQPELFYSGVVADLDRSALDTSFDHPFGFDLDLDVTPDPPFELLVKNRSAANKTLHTELEVNLFPQAAFGWTPAAGDRMAMRGAWIFDCGHPPYETEMHPPGFVSFARAADEKTTIALAFAVPFRVTQLFGPAAKVADFGDPLRLRNSGDAFPTAFFNEILLAAFTNKDHLELHALLEELRFETLAFSVCAPSPRPAKAHLGYSHRFAVRGGVTVTAAAHDDTGCVEYTAKMATSYRSAVPERLNEAWTWDQISAQATEEFGGTLDVRQLIIGELKARNVTGDVTALHEDHPPVIDTYAPLVPRADAAADAPTSISTADDQPYPFHGRARVYWQ